MRIDRNMCGSAICNANKQTNNHAHTHTHTHHTHHITQGTPATAGATASSSPIFYDHEGHQLAELEAQPPKQATNRSPRRVRHKFDSVTELPGDYDDDDDYVSQTFAPDANGKMRLVRSEMQPHPVLCQRSIAQIDCNDQRVHLCRRLLNVF
jgi:hypothetical protein